MYLTTFFVVLVSTLSLILISRYFSYKKYLREKEKEIAELERQAREKDEQIKEIEKEKEEETANLKLELERQAEQIKEKDERIKKKEKEGEEEIANLKSELERQAREKDEQIKEKEKEKEEEEETANLKSELERQTREKEEQIKEKEKEKEEEIANLKSELERQTREKEEQIKEKEKEKEETAKLRSVLEKHQENKVTVNREKRDYEVVVDLKLKKTKSFSSIEAINKEVYENLKNCYKNKTIVIFGDYNIGKTFFLGRLFNFQFLAESHIKHTKGFSLSKIRAKGENFYYTLVDCEGWNTPVPSTNKDELSIQFAKEGLFQDTSIHIGDFIILMMDKCSCENSQKILGFRNQAFLQKKSILVVFNWRNAKTIDEIEKLKTEEILETFPICCDEGTVIKITRDEVNKLSDVNVYWLGDDEAKESRKHNDETVSEITKHFQSHGVFLESSPLLMIAQQFELIHNSNTNESGHKSALSQLLQSKEPSEDFEIKESSEGEIPQGTEDSKMKVYVKSEHLRELDISMTCKIINTRIFFKTVSVIPDLHYSGSQYVRCEVFDLVAQSYVDKKENMKPNSFFVEVIHKGFNYRIHSCQVNETDGERIQRAQESNKLSVYQSNFEKTNEWMVYKIDLLFGRLYVWIIKVDDSATPIKESLEEVQKERENVLKVHLKTDQLIYEKCPDLKLIYPLPPI